MEATLASTAQTLLNDPIWDQASQGKDAVSNRLFAALLKRNVYNKEHCCSTHRFYAAGYLKNIDFYYVSYEETGDLTLDYMTEFYRIHPSTDIRKFDYTKTSLFVDDPNPDFMVLWDIGRVDAFDETLVIYHPRHVALYKRNKTDKNYQSVHDTGIGYDSYDEFRYDPATHKLTRKTTATKAGGKRITETYRLVEGKFLRSR